VNRNCFGASWLSAGAVHEQNLKPGRRTQSSVWIRLRFILVLTPAESASSAVVKIRSLQTHSWTSQKAFEHIPRARRRVCRCRANSWIGRKISGWPRKTQRDRILYVCGRRTSRFSNSPALSPARSACAGNYADDLAQGAYWRKTGRTNFLSSSRNIGGDNVRPECRCVSQIGRRSAGSVEAGRI